MSVKEEDSMNHTLNQTRKNHPEFNFDWQVLRGIGLKDCSRKVVERQYPEMKVLLDHLFSLIPQKKFALVDVFHLDFKDAQKTCVNSDWHLDGKMRVDNPEHYAIWAEGGCLTKFMVEPMVVCREEMESRNAFNRFAFFRKTLGSHFHDDDIGFEIIERQPISYTTFDFHKGRNIPTREGERFFCRVMTSDFFRPKNKIYGRNDG